MPKDIRFVKGKETKNTFKFDEKPESGQPPIMGNLYLPKWLLEQNGNPSEVTVTLNLASAAAATKAA